MEERFNELWIFIRGILISFGLTLILFFILGIILSTTSVSESIITPAIIVITGISILISTSVVMLKSNQKGMIKGGIIGGVYFFIIYLLSSLILKNFDVNVYSVIMLCVCFACGGIGGIVGVNIKN